MDIGSPKSRSGDQVKGDTKTEYWHSGQNTKDSKKNRRGFTTDCYYGGNVSGWWHADSQPISCCSFNEIQPHSTTPISLNTKFRCGFICPCQTASEQEAQKKQVLTYHTYQPVQNKCRCGIMSAIMEGWYAIMFPAVVALFKVSSPTWVQCTNWL